MTSNDMKKGNAGVVRAKKEDCYYRNRTRGINRRDAFGEQRV